MSISCSLDCSYSNLSLLTLTFFVDKYRNMAIALSALVVWRTDAEIQVTTFIIAYFGMFIFLIIFPF